MGPAGVEFLDQILHDRHRFLYNGSIWGELQSNTFAHNGNSL